MSEWGNPPGVSQVSCTEYIGVGGERGGLVLEHLWTHVVGRSNERRRHVSRSHENTRDAEVAHFDDVVLHENVPACTQ